MAASIPDYTIECGICLEEFTHPKLLPCFHTYCLNCLSTHIAAHGDDTRFSCPTCRKEITVPEGGPERFTDNFYIRNKMVVDNSYLTCDKHKEMKLKFYCRDCSKPVCGDCLLGNHHNHARSDLIDVGGESKELLTSLKDKLEDKVDQYNVFLENLEIKSTHFDDSTAETKKNVEKKGNEICKIVMELVKQRQADITKLADEEQHTLMKPKEDIQAMRSSLKEGIKYSNQMLQSPSAIPVLDIVPIVQSLSRDSDNVNLDYPCLRYPVFPEVDVNTAILSQQLGCLHNDGEEFTVSFNVNQVIPDEWYFSKNLNNNNLPWRVGMIHTGSLLHVGLFLHSQQIDATVTCDNSIKIINIKNDSKSHVKHYKNAVCERRCAKTQINMDWNTVIDKQSGFIDDKNNVTVQVTLRSILLLF